MSTRALAAELAALQKKNTDRQYIYMYIYGDVYIYLSATEVQVLLVP